MAEMSEPFFYCSRIGFSFTIWPDWLEVVDRFSVSSVLRGRTRVIIPARTIMHLYLDSYPPTRKVEFVTEDGRTWKYKLTTQSEAARARAAIETAIMSSPCA
jgi:hypothetical protein